MSAANDFKILNPPKPPIWRDPKRLQEPIPRNIVVAVISVFVAVVSLLPPRNGYREPISLQIARGETQAWLIFALIGIAVLAAVPTLVRAKRYVSGLFCMMVVGGLWALASTKPMSSLHLDIFVYLASSILAWVWGLWATLQDGKLLLAACLATVGAISCLFSFGVGERLIILSSLTTLNTLLLTDLLE